MTAVLPAAGMLRLSPRATLECEFAAAPGPHGPVRPSSSLPISLFVPPAALGPLQALATRLADAWRRIASAALSRDRLPDPACAAAILGALARELVDGSPALAAVVRAEGEPLRLIPRRPLQVDAVCYPIDRLTFHADRDPARLTVPPIRFALGPDRPTPAALGQVIARLAAGVEPGALRAELAAAPALAEMVNTLWFAGLLDAAAPARRALPPGTILHLGHASLLANLGGAHVLIDPWLPPASASDRVAPPAIAELPPLAAICFTHHHWDHVHPDTLLRLPRDVPVYVPRQDPTRTLGPRTEAVLAYLGFTDVRALRHGDAVVVGEGGEVVAAPFFGEDPTRLGFVGNTYVLRHAGAAALVHVDSAADADGRSMVTTGAAAALATRFGPLDPVLVTRRQERGMMIEHTWEFLLQPADRWPRPTENCDHDAAAIAALAASTGARRVVLYSEGGADWYPDGTDFLRRATPTARTAPFEYLWDSLSDISAAVTAVGAQVVMSAPFDLHPIGSSGS